MDQSVQVNLPVKERKQYSGIPLKIMKLLGMGCLPVEAARACGVDESYVSQLKKEEDFVEQVNEMVAKTFAHQSEIDNNYVAIEKKLSDRLLKNAEFMFSDDKILRALKFVNEAKKKVPTAFANGQNPNGAGPTVLQPVTLILPVAVTKEYVLNPLNEIVGINGKELTTLPSTMLPGLIAKHKENVLIEQKEEKEKKQGFKILPNGSRQTDPYSDL